MNWSHFLTYNEAPTHAFEALCNQLFELWINRTYGEDKQTFIVVNGSGGDGGVEAYSTLMDGKEVGVQAKWFPDSINSSQFTQIKNSILTAKSVHPNLIEYIVCVPRDLSNVKVGKNGQLVKNTENSKWEKCVADINEIHPDMKIYFWGDYKLTEQLQYAEAAGVRQYWFDKEELTKEALQYSFEKQKSGWLAQRYIPVLHNQGQIHDKVSSFLGNQHECDSLLDELNSVEKKYQELYRESESLCEILQGKEQYKEKVEILQEISRRTLLQLKELIIIRDAFTYEKKLPEWQEYVMSDRIAYEMMIWAEKNSFGDFGSHFGSMKKAIEAAVYGINLPYLCEKLERRSAYEKILILGAQGTGKTHGIANEVEILLKEGFMVPVLIQAKSVSYGDDWKDILTRTLGLAQIWGEDELWTALEAMTYRIERNHPLENNGVKIMPKVLICIDGIDEVKPYSRWTERINQVNAIIARHPRIRFCFTGRQYAFDKSALVQEQKYKMVYLSDDGDVPVKNIYDSYIQHYHVNDEGAKWIKYSISTPYALKLMCEIYRGSSICNFGKSDVTVTKLLKKKFVALDQEFKASIGLDESVQINIIKTVLIKLNDMFQINNEVSGLEIKRVLRQHTIFQYLHELGLDQVLDFLEKQSFLQSYHKSAKSIFEEEETIYLLGVQPVYDYLKALRLYEKGEYTDDLMIEQIIMENISVMQMYSVMILERDGKIIWNNKNCRKYINIEDLFRIVAFALVNVDIKFSCKYQEWVAAIMRKNAYTLGQVVNYVIFPLARYAGHPLGSDLLDKYLKEFEKPAERDLVWSVPTGLGYNENTRWIRIESIHYINDGDVNGIEDTDEYDGLPLVWAWGLSSVDNHQRTLVRQRLVKWGIAQPLEFLKLFLHFCDVNDAQIYADLFSIAMAVSYVRRTNRVFLKELSQWILHNIFGYDKIKNIYNAAIRYYARAIMECAFSEKIITKKQIEKCRPPYKINTSLLPFAAEATNCTMMSGYKTLDYDLARYVLCDPINRMFFNNRNFRNKINALLKKYEKKYGVENLTSEKFILGSAFGYIKLAGWNEVDFYGKPNGGKEGEEIGVDIAIIRKYYPATHGSMSEVMSITEKYAWCAKMEILGYLADRLLYNDYNNAYVHDYGIMEDYVNPYQELRQIDLDKVMAETKWILPETLVPYIKECSFNEKGIRKWLQESPMPDFSKWIHINGEEVSLYATHIMNNEKQGVSTMMWISSGLIHMGTMPRLLQELGDGNFTQSLYNAADILAYPEADCYISPLEVCWFDWKEELESYIPFGNNIIYKNVARCVCDVQNGGENYYELPSKIVRKLLGIITGDGYHYFNSAGEEIAYCTSAGERYGDCQHILLANEKLFYSKLKEANLQPVWIIRVLKESSAKARERFDFFADKDETYLVWKSNRKWLSRKL